MSRRRRKLVHVRKSRLRITPKGKIRLSKPSLRIGGRTGVNLSSRGVSFSTRGPAGSYNSRTGCRSKIPGCLIPILVFVVSIAVGIGVAGAGRGL